MPREHLQVFNALDVAKTQSYHIRVLMVAAMGAFTASYDRHIFFFLTNLLGRLYFPKEAPGILPGNVAGAFVGINLCGALAGSLFLGYLGDEKGRKRIYRKALMLLLSCSIGSGLSCGKSPPAVISTFFFFQFWIGFALSGVYSLCPIIMAEYASKRRRGTFVAAVCAMGGLGKMAAGLVAFIVSSVFMAKYPAPSYEVDPIGSTNPAADYVWRLMLILGAIPATLTYYLLAKLSETTRYTALVAKDPWRAVADLPKGLQVNLEAEQKKIEQFLRERENDFGLFSKRFIRRHGLHLLGTTTTCFLSGIVMDSYRVVPKDMLSLIGMITDAKTMNAVEEVKRFSRVQVLAEVAILIPGYLLPVAVIEMMGRRAIQLMGFFFTTLFTFALAIPYHHWIASKDRIGLFSAFSLFYVATRFCHITIYIMAAEIFPTRLRSTCHGITVASGRAGQITGAYWFLFFADSLGNRTTMMILGIIGFLGMLLTFLLPEPNGKSLEELSGEAE